MEESHEVEVFQAVDVVDTVRAMPQDKKALIKRTVAPDATDAELDLFIYDCLRRGTHPLDKMVHFTKRGGRYTPITSIDYMRARAAASGEMAGSDDAIFEEAIGAPHPDKATVAVYRMCQGVRCSYTASARWEQYYPGDGQPGFMWRKMPHVMLAKVAEALALRKAFPAELQGLYAREEMDQSEEGGRSQRTSTKRGSFGGPVSAARPQLPGAARNGAGMPAPDPLGDTKTEHKRAFALMEKYGWDISPKGQDERHRLYSRATGLTIDSADKARFLSAKDWRAISDLLKQENEPPLIPA